MRILDGFVLTVERLGREPRGEPGSSACPWPSARTARVLPVRYLCDLYVKLVIRGTPLLVQIYLFYYVIGTAWGIDNQRGGGRR